ncbi:alkene reductase [Bradyrhizobium sp. Pha-3]|uniref:alkene reductase n=1 Tax=Bradyrhizobium sp. Pha-3 TaxID=208375 RepID=UPI0035D508E2
MVSLLEPISLGDVLLPNRIAMSPMTRNRVSQGVVSQWTPEYYRQRATAGLIVSEASQVSPEGQGYDNTPGIYASDHVKRWKQVTEAVHAAGGRIFLQLWHVGRVSHVFLQPRNQPPLAPSAIVAKTKVMAGGEFRGTSMPRALTTEEILHIVGQFRRGAANAIAAGFDGVEIHGSNGYLLDQFLKKGSNVRNDRYGGSIENRVRFPIEVAQAVAEEIGRSRIGFRMGPVTPANDVSDPDPQPLFEHLAERLGEIGIAYIHVVEGAGGITRRNMQFDYGRLRKLFRGIYIANNCYTPADAKLAVATGAADMVSFGRPFIANPDLVARITRDVPLNAADPSTFYGGNSQGYTDYPTVSSGLDPANSDARATRVEGNQGNTAK